MTYFGIDVDFYSALERAEYVRTDVVQMKRKLPKISVSRIERGMVEVSRAGEARMQGSRLESFSSVD